MTTAAHDHGCTCRECAARLVAAERTQLGLRNPDQVPLFPKWWSESERVDVPGSRAKLARFRCPECKLWTDALKDAPPRCPRCEVLPFPGRAAAPVAPPEEEAPLQRFTVDVELEDGRRFEVLVAGDDNDNDVDLVTRARNLVAPRVGLGPVARATIRVRR